VKIEGVKYREVGRTRTNGIDVVLAAPVKGRGPLRAVPVEEWVGGALDEDKRKGSVNSDRRKGGVTGAQDGNSADGCSAADEWARTKWPAAGPKSPRRHRRRKWRLGCSPAMLWLLGVIGALAWLLGCTS
jgi:hypothetical protein